MIKAKPCAVCRSVLSYVANHEGFLPARLLATYRSHPEVPGCDLDLEEVAFQIRQDAADHAGKHGLAVLRRSNFLHKVEERKSHNLSVRLEVDIHGVEQLIFGEDDSEAFRQYSRDLQAKLLLEEEAEEIREALAAKLQRLAARNPVTEAQLQTVTF